MDEDLGEDDDWLKMDQPPDWLKPEEPEDYDEWTPPPKEPLVPPPLEVNSNLLKFILYLNLY